MENFYNKDGIVVRRSNLKDAHYLSANLRDSDVREIWDSDNITPEEALLQGLDQSIFCCTILNGSPLAMFGIVPETVLGNKASIWMLATEGLSKINIKVIRDSKHFIKIMLAYFPYLHNYVSNDNKESIKWLKFCGAKIKEPEVYGKEKKLFRYFSFERR